MSTQPLSDSPQPNQHRAGMLAIVTVIVAVAAIVGGWFYFSAPSPKRFQGLVDSLIDGDLKAVPTGVVSTARSYPGLMPRDEMFISRRPDGSLLALFPTYRNKGTDIAGLLFTSRPLRDSDTYPQPTGLNIEKRRIDVGGARKLFIDSRIDEHWYRVSYGLE